MPPTPTKPLEAQCARQRQLTISASSDALCCEAKLFAQSPAANATDCCTSSSCAACGRSARALNTGADREAAQNEIEARVCRKPNSASRCRCIRSTNLWSRELRARHALTRAPRRSGGKLTFLSRSRRARVAGKRRKGVRRFRLGHDYRGWWARSDPLPTLADRSALFTSNRRGRDFNPSR